MALVSSILSLLCSLENLPGPPQIHFQNMTLQLWSVDLKHCEKFDLHRESMFYLYKRNFRQKPKVIVPYDDQSLWNSEIDFRLKTIIFFHGFVGSYKNKDAQSIKNAFLETGNYNIIIVQNERLLAGPNYYIAVGNCKPIARFSGAFIDYLVMKGLRLEDLHLIGLSLGAQIAGMTGQFVTTGKLHRITALDPAGPLFNEQPEDNRIDPSDAHFIDVIFTNSGTYSMKYSVGHANFFPNGGKKQPGCSALGVVKRYGFSRLYWILFCHHFRSYQLYVESIKFPKLFPSKMCDSYSTFKCNFCSNSSEDFMGYGVSHNARGDYYLDTGYIGVFN